MYVVPNTFKIGVNIKMDDKIKLANILKTELHHRIIILQLR